MTCYYAAEYGHLELLQWLHSAGCPLDYETYVAAEDYEDMEMMQWLRTIENDSIRQYVHRRR